MSAHGTNTRCSEDQILKEMTLESNDHKHKTENI